jgi:hypothetical protein
MAMARLTGLEPATPGVTGRYSNQLSYNRASYVPFPERPDVLLCAFCPVKRPIGKIRRQPPSLWQRTERGTLIRAPATSHASLLFSDTCHDTARAHSFAPEPAGLAISKETNQWAGQDHSRSMSYRRVMRCSQRRFTFHEKATDTRRASYHNYRG